MALNASLHQSARGVLQHSYFEACDENLKCENSNESCVTQISRPYLVPVPNY